jgi:hypothetical protein
MLESVTIPGAVCPIPQLTGSFRATRDIMPPPDPRLQRVEDQVRSAVERISGAVERIATIEGKMAADHTLRNIVISVGLSAILGFLCWLGIEVTNQGKTLSGIGILLRPLEEGKKLGQAASQPTNAENIERAQKIITDARAAGTKIPISNLKEAGESFLAASEANESSWDAVLAIVGYRSAFNPSPIAPASFSDPKRIEGGQSNGDSNHPPLIGYWNIGTSGQLSYSISWPMTSVPEDDAYIYRKIDEPKTAKTHGRPYLRVSKPIGPGFITLDGFRLKNVIFEGMKISYQGGPLILENVTFINCTFGIGRGSKGTSFANKLLDLSPSVDFAA